MVELFAHYRNLIIFLHVIAAVVWVGGMIAIRFATHQSLAKIDDPKMRLERVSHTLKRLFAIVWPLVLVLLATAIVMAVGLGFREAAMDETGNVVDEYAMSLYSTVLIKEAIWFVMALNLGVMMWRRRQAQIALERGDVPRARDMLAPIARFMVPVNITLGVIAIFIGVVLRNAY